jgi:hypothetical protein
MYLAHRFVLHAAWFSKLGLGSPHCQHELFILDKRDLIGVPALTQGIESPSTTALSAFAFSVPDAVMMFWPTLLWLWPQRFFQMLAHGYITWLVAFIVVHTVAHCRRMSDTWQNWLHRKGWRTYRYHRRHLLRADVNFAMVTQFGDVLCRTVGRWVFKETTEGDPDH